MSRPPWVCELYLRAGNERQQQYRRLDGDGDRRQQHHPSQCGVVLAENGFDALAKLSDHGPDIVFCDVLMPRLDGYQTCALIKKSPRFRNTPVIMLSSKDGLFDRARGRLVGSEEYLTKPFTKDSLLKCVQEHSRRSEPELVTATMPQ